jgi:serine/threonine protein kinase/Tfp pilus assembly protein PilF
LNATERARFLDEACADDEGLREEVESLISASDLSASPLHTPIYKRGLELLAGDGRELPEDSFIGKYRVLKPLGSGGMGDVYLALDPDLSRQVALKILPVHLSGDSDFISRFQREAHAASIISHTNIAHIYEIGKSDGRYYIAMEYVEGTTLREQLAEGPIKPDQALDITRQVCAVLSAAHEKGVIHRDIKPENIMLARDGYVKVLDFGLAKLTQPEETSPSATGIASNITEPGKVMGTCRYMSPEQVRAIKVDRRTDLWSVGVVFYEMLAGQPPFAGEREADVIAAILKTEPALIHHPSTLISSKLNQIITRSLHKKVDERYQTVAELMADLNRLERELDSGSKDARPIRAPIAYWEKLRGSFSRPWKQTVSSVVTIALACLMLTGLFMWINFRGRSGASLISSGANEAYQLGKFHLQKRTTGDINRAIEYFQEVIKAHPNYAPAYAELAQAYILLPFYSETLPGDSYPKANEMAQQALRLDESLAKAHTVIAKYKEQYTWDFAGAEKEYHRSIELDPNDSTTHQWYAECLSHLARHEEAIREIKRARELDPASLTINAVMGLIFIEARQFDEAIKQLQITLSLDRNFPLAHEFLGDAYIEKGKYQDAIREYEAATLLYGKDAQSKVAQRTAALKDAYANGGARAYWLKRLEQRLEDNSHGYVYQPAGVAMIYARIGEVEQAFQWLEKAYDARDESILWLKNEQGYDNIRSDPRFENMVQRVGLGK